MKLQSRSGRMTTSVALMVVFCALLAASLACNEKNMERMRARDIPEWVCPSQTPIPECMLTPTEEPGEDGEPGIIPTYNYPSECFVPTATPFVLHESFRLGRRVRIGGVNGIGMGIWVTMDNVEVSDHPYTITNPVTGVSDQLWIASWDVKISNASWTNDYEMYPFAQLYVLAVTQLDGPALGGAWPIDEEAHEEIGLPKLTLDAGENGLILKPGESKTLTVAAYIPGPWPLHLGYILDPFDDQDVEEMLERQSVGSNVGLWITDHDDSCPYGDIEPLPGQFEGDPGIYVPGYLLTRHPVEGVSISRGFGCNKYWTGIYGNGCHGDTPWFHNGVDYAWKSGSPIFDPLPTSGSISFAGQDDTPDCSATYGSLPPHAGFGNFVKEVGTVDGHSITLWYGHLTSILVGTGAKASPGQVLGTMGSTGCSTGSHLHFQVRVDGYTVNPQALIPPNAPP